MDSILDIHIAKVFSRCPTLKIWKICETDNDKSTPLGVGIFSALGPNLISVECGVSVVFMSLRSFQSLKVVDAERLHTFLYSSSLEPGGQSIFQCTK